MAHYQIIGMITTVKMTYGNVRTYISLSWYLCHKELLQLQNLYFYDCNVWMCIILSVWGYIMSSYVSWFHPYVSDTVTCVCYLSDNLCPLVSPPLSYTVCPLVAPLYVPWFHLSVWHFMSLVEPFMSTGFTFLSDTLCPLVSTLLVHIW